MRFILTKRIVAVIIIVIAFGVLVFIGLYGGNKPLESIVTPPIATTDLGPKYEVIGYSVDGRAIEVFTYGGGNTHLLFVGGMHGGYEWNSVLLAYAFMDYLDIHPEAIPDGFGISVIPSINPDGVYKVIGKEGHFDIADVSTSGNFSPGRFNAHNVDLNRNFDCKWKSKSTWRGNVVSAGTAPFSEPETAALRDFVKNTDQQGVVFWHSQSNAVYASECENGILPVTRDIMNVYAKAAGYPAVDVFDAYEITGDSEGWLASIGIPAITVELSTHDTIEWSKNLAGVKALIGYYAQKNGVNK